MDIDRHRRLFEVTDRLLRLKRDPDALTRTNYKELLTDICAAFRESLDHGLADAFFKLRQANDPDTIEDVRKIFYDVQRFLEYTEFQKEALKACGLSEDGVESVIRHIGAVRGIIADESYDPGELVAAVKRSTDGVCRAADTVQEQQARTEANHSLRKYSLIATGSVIVLASAVLIGTAGAAAPAMFVASGLFGNWLIVIGNLIKNPLDLPPK